MIINQNNKDNILKGVMKRGFNQTPTELKEKLYSEKKENSKEINEIKQKNNSSLKATFLRLKKLDK